jgi:hypothetical protein
MDYLTQLSHCLAGVFQNREQALAEPAWYVHLKLWSYPVPLFADSATFFIEQASAAFNQPPYRQRVLRIFAPSANPEQIIAEYYALKSPHEFQGGAEEPQKLHRLTPDQLQSLSGSQLLVQAYELTHGTRFEARQPPGEYCRFAVNGEVKGVQLGFDAIAQAPSSAESSAFWMYDKGIDLQTGKTTWGATSGPFRLIKIQDWSTALPSILTQPY